MVMSRRRRQTEWDGSKVEKGSSAPSHTCIKNAYKEAYFQGFISLSDLKH